MEEDIAEWRMSSSGKTTINDDETLSRVFSQLKPYCLELLQNPKKNVPSISRLSEFLREAPYHAFRPFLDYALFPLLLLLDAAVSCRSPQNFDSKGKFGLPNVPGMPLSISDNVAECVLLCLDELLKKCHLGSVNQMIIVLKKLTYGALLSPPDTAEEFREGIVRCFRAIMLLRLHPCSVDSCICKDITGLPPSLARESLHVPLTLLEYSSEPDECLLEFLQLQNASPAVGHWLSLLLKIADNEAKRGHR